MQRGIDVKGIRSVDGDASTLTALAIYVGSDTSTYTLESTDTLYVTSVVVACETGGDVIIDCDTDGDGDAEAFDVLLDIALPANGFIEYHFETPWACPVGSTPKFAGAATNKNFCMITGYVTKV